MKFPDIFRSNHFQCCACNETCGNKKKTLQEAAIGEEKHETRDNRSP